MIRDLCISRGGHAIFNGVDIDIPRGKVVGQGTPADPGRTDSAWVCQLMQGLPDGPLPFDYPGPDYLQDLLEVTRP